MDNHGVIGVPKDLMGMDSYNRFQNEFYGYPERNDYNEYEKLKIKSAIKGKEYHRISSSLWVAEFMDIPSELIKSIEFVSEYKLAITFYESEEFCVEKFFNTNFDLFDGKKLTIKYLNKEGYAIRTDTYTVTKLLGIDKKPLANEAEDIKVKITLECKNHDISTCKE
jgi:hypothetical protein